MHSPTASLSAGLKRAYQDDLPPIQAQSSSAGAQSPASPPKTSAAANSAFRNVSACNRCRLRKNRCDQRLPACAACEKAKVRCVGYDPITKQEIPRSYVYYLESRIYYLEELLDRHDVAFDPPQAFDLDSKVGPASISSPTVEQGSIANGGIKAEDPKTLQDKALEKKQDDAERLNNLVSNIGMVSVQGASDPRYLGSTSGISFARVVFAAVKSSVSTNVSERGGMRQSKPMGNASSTATMRDSFFGLQTRPTIKQAPFPDKELGSRLVNLYFEHANPQIPILHRGEFMKVFEKAYATEQRVRGPRELYMLNIVFAIGAGTIWGSSDSDTSAAPHSDYRRDPTYPLAKRVKTMNQQCQPEEYHASAIVHLESFLGSSSSTDEGFGGGLEELQAVCLLAGFALLRPVAPGLWYIVGVAVRLAVDLGLHYEDGSGIDTGSNSPHATDEDTNMTGISGAKASKSIDTRERGRREWVRDLRRRLWWCTYAFDRLVSTCVGRPFGITDQVITTEFPSLLDDKYITKAGFTQPTSIESSYKHVAHHYLKLRLLQSEILNVLQYTQAKQARAGKPNSRDWAMRTDLPSPYMVKFDSFRTWRRDIDRRLWEWKETAPRQEETGVQFSLQFLELNYWQAVIMLYRQSLTVPPPLEDDIKRAEEVSSPSVASPSTMPEDKEDEDEVFLKVAEAGQKVLKLYRQLHRVRLVNYTFLATHHLFMAGISFLYAVWHSPKVRGRLVCPSAIFKSTTMLTSHRHSMMLTLQCSPRHQFSQT